MAGIITTGNNPKLLWPGLAGFFGTEYEQIQSMIDRVFDMRDSTKNYEEIQELAGFGYAGVKDESNSIS